MRNSKKKSVIPKDKKIDLIPQNEVKQMFMSWFKKHNNVGQVMTKQDVVRNILTKLDAKQNSSLEAAMNALRKDGFITVEKDGVTLVLTKAGSDSL